MWHNCVRCAVWNRKMKFFKLLSTIWNVFFVYSWWWRFGHFITFSFLFNFLLLFDFALSKLNKTEIVCENNLKCGEKFKSVFPISFDNWKSPWTLLTNWFLLENKKIIDLFLCFLEKWWKSVKSLAMYY